MNDKMPDVIYTQYLGFNSEEYLIAKHNGEEQKDGGTKYIRSDLHDRRVTELLEANNRLVEENRKLKAGLQPWQPIEIAPKDRNRVIVTDGFEVCDAYFNNGDWWQYECGDDWYSVTINPTHWMPLPEPPRKED